MNGIDGIVERGCPNCYKSISFERLMRGLPCSRCFSGKDICSDLKVKGEIAKLCEFKSRLESFEEFFKQKIGFSPYSLQISWMKRILLQRSFGIIAPTGVGKTTFGLITALYLKKSLIIVPTAILVEEVEKKLRKFGGKDIVAIHSKMKKKEREEKELKLKQGSFNIAVITSAYLYKHWNEIKHSYKFIFVDDVDSFLKSGKNIDYVLYLMGFSKKEIRLAEEVIKMKKEGKKDEKLFKYVESLKNKVNTILVLSSATGKPKERVRLFYELLGFQVGKSATTLRNVIDVHDKLSDKRLIELLNKLKSGILIFVSQTYGREGSLKVFKMLKERGFKVEHYENINSQILEEFRRGKIDILVGIASYRNPLARGLDIPEKAKYAIFYGVPNIEFKVKEVDKPSLLTTLLWSLRRIIGKEVDEYLNMLQKGKLEEVKKFVLKSLKDPEVVDKINSNERVNVKIVGNDIVISYGDVAGYIQASGRTSRMYAGGLTKGLSILLVDDKKTFNSLKKRLKWFKEGEPFMSIEEVDLDKIIKEIEDERKTLKGRKAGDVKVSLVVVESPNKVRTIARFFSSYPVKRKILNSTFYEFTIGSKVFLITASIGHILDLVTKKGRDGIVFSNNITPIYDTIKKCKDGRQFVDELTCESSDKMDIIKSLREASIEVDEVIIATDPDREGEKIAFDIFIMLRPFTSNIKRAEFHSITPSEFLNAINKPREIDINLVKAQIVRRILDRVIGFDLSKVVQQHFKIKNLSVGRVQTPVLGWIIKRFEESKEKIKVKRRTFISNNKSTFVDFKEYIRKVKKEKAEVFPPKPLSTSDLLREFKAPSTKIMNSAQKLFESGLITYHRTDSHRVSNAGIGLAKQLIEEIGLKDLFNPRAYSKEGGAHECIRPAKAVLPEELKELSGQMVNKLDDFDIKLYEFIFKRFIASQMKPAVVERDVYEVDGNMFYVNTKLIEPGYTLILPNIKILPNYSFHDKVVEVPKATPLTENQLVEMMKEKGIGRPSTYAYIIETLLKRKYVIRKGVLIPTEIGKRVHSFSISRFGMFVSEVFTREMEKEIDEVEKAIKDYKEVILRYVKALDKSLSA